MQVINNFLMLVSFKIRGNIKIILNSFNFASSYFSYLMNIHKLKNIFNPQRIALIGVTTNPNSVSGKVLIKPGRRRIPGVVYPVNPENEAVMGIPCYPDVRSLPKVPDLGIICTAAEKVPGLVRECGEAGIRGLIIMSAGFQRDRGRGKVLEDEIRREIKRFDGMRIIGPNCLGIIVPGLKLNASFASAMPKAGNIAFISQSGAFAPPSSTGPSKERSASASSYPSATALMLNSAT